MKPTVPPLPAFGAYGLDTATTNKVSSRTALANARKAMASNAAGNNLAPPADPQAIAPAADAGQEFDWGDEPVGAASNASKSSGNLFKKATSVVSKIAGNAKNTLSDAKAGQAVLASQGTPWIDLRENGGQTSGDSGSAAADTKPTEIKPSPIEIKPSPIEITPDPVKIKPNPIEITPDPNAANDLRPGKRTVITDDSPGVDQPKQPNSVNLNRDVRASSSPRSSSITDSSPGVDQPNSVNLTGGLVEDAGKTNKFLDVAGKVLRSPEFKVAGKVLGPVAVVGGFLASDGNLESSAPIMIDGKQYFVGQKVPADLQHAIDNVSSQKVSDLKVQDLVESGNVAKNTGQPITYALINGKVYEVGTSAYSKFYEQTANTNSGSPDTTKTVENAALGKLNYAGTDSKGDKVYANSKGEGEVVTPSGKTETYGSLNYNTKTGIVAGTIIHPSASPKENSPASHASPDLVRQETVSYAGEKDVMQNIFADGSVTYVKAGKVLGRSTVSKMNSDSVDGPASGGKQIGATHAQTTHSSSSATSATSSSEASANGPSPSQSAITTPLSKEVKISETSGGAYKTSAETTEERFSGQSTTAVKSGDSNTDTTPTASPPREYTGGAKPVQSFTKGETTTTITSSGAVIEQSAGNTAYRAGWVDPTKSYTDMSQVKEDLQSGASNPYSGTSDSSAQMVSDAATSGYSKAPSTTTSAAPVEMVSDAASSGPTEASPPPEYTGGAKPVNSFTSGNTTITVTATGAVIEQTAGGTAYRAGWVDPTKSYGDMSQVKADIQSGTSNPYNEGASIPMVSDAASSGGGYNAPTSTPLISDAASGNGYSAPPPADTGSAPAMVDTTSDNQPAPVPTPSYESSGAAAVAQSESSGTPAVNYQAAKNAIEDRITLPEPTHNDTPPVGFNPWSEKAHNNLH